MKSSTTLAALVAHCRKLARRQQTSDAELLRRFIHQRQAAAFEELLERYAPLVWGVCRRIVRSEPDCEDAFQAVFLALFRQASSVDPERPLGAWLHGVAVRTALKAAKDSARQHISASVPEQATVGDVADELGDKEIFRIVDQEITRLPSLLQAPFVLCCLEGRTRDEAAAALGCSVAAIKSRLERGRGILRRRLERRGLELPAAFLVLGLTGGQVCASLRAKALQSVLSCAPPAVAALVPAAGASLASKLTLTAMAVVLAGGLGFGVFHSMQAELPTEAPPQKAEAPLPAAEIAQPGAKPGLDRQGDPLPPLAVLRLGSSRLRPAGSVHLLAFSPDGSKVAAQSSVLYVRGELSVWDVRTGRLLRRMGMPKGGVHALSWRADGRRILLLQSGKVLAWDFTDKSDLESEPRAALRGGKSAAPANGPQPDNERDSCYALSPDGETIAVGREGERLDKERPIRLRSLKSGIPPGKSAEKDLCRQPGNCGMLLFTPDGKKLVAVNKAKQLPGNRQEDKQLVVVWDAVSGKEIVRFTAPRPASNHRAAVAVSNRLLALGLEDGAAGLWDLSSGKERRLNTDHVGKNPGAGFGTFAVVFSPDGKMLVSGGRDDRVKLWDVASGRRLHTLERHYSWVETLAVSPDGRTVASSGQDGLIRLWDAVSGKDACPQVGHKHTVSLTALTPDGKTAVTAGWDNTLRWWDMSKGREIRVVELPRSLMGLAISPDGKTVLGALHEEFLHTWDLTTGRESTPTNLPRQKVGALAFTPDGKQFVSASGAHVSVWEWPALKLVRTIELPKPVKSPGENECESLAISPDGRWLATVAHRSWYREEKGLRFGYGADGVVDLWDLTTGKRVRRLADGPNVFRTAAFTADGRLVLMGGGGNSIPAEGKRPAQKLQEEISLIDPLAARLVRGFSSPPTPANVQVRYITGSLLSPDGRILYVAYNSGTIIGYETATGQPRRTLSGHLDYVGALASAADGRRLISGGNDGAALVWDVTLAAAATPRKTPLDAATVEKLWATATRSDAKSAFAALADLAATGEQTVALLRKQIKPIPKGPSDVELDRVFENLDSDDFTVRDKASRDLADFGESAVPGVRKRLVKGVSLELRLRALAFLDRFDHKELSPGRLRQLRAVELLEGIGTPDARKLLLELAHGAPGVPQTLEAAAALARLESADKAEPRP
jgi:RNA polymerase sigma factor (sigma-70 family)